MLILLGLRKVDRINDLRDFGIGLDSGGGWWELAGIGFWEGFVAVIFGEGGGFCLAVIDIIEGGIEDAIDGALIGAPGEGFFDAGVVCDGDFIAVAGAGDGGGDLIGIGEAGVIDDFGGA